MSGGAISISARSSGAGSSSTTMAMFFIASRNRLGIEASASATSCSNCFRRTGFRDDQAVVVAIVAYRALLAERARAADPAAVKDQRVRRARPAGFRQGGAELLFDYDGIVGFGDADPVRDPEHVAIDRQPWNAERMSENDVGRLSADARQFDQRCHARRHFTAVFLHECLGHSEERFRFRAKESCRVN